MVLRDFGAGDQEQRILAFGACGFLFDVRHVVVEGFLRDREPPLSQSGDPSKTREEILLCQNVIGNREDVEFLGLAVQINDLTKAEPSIAPRCVYMEIAQEKRLVPGHAQARTSSCVVSDGR